MGIYQTFCMDVPAGFFLSLLRGLVFGLCAFSWTHRAVCTESCLILFLGHALLIHDTGCKQFSHPSLLKTCFRIFVPFPTHRTMLIARSHMPPSQGSTLSCKDNELNLTLPPPFWRAVSDLCTFSESCKVKLVVGVFSAAEVHMPSVGCFRHHRWGFVALGCVEVLIVMNLYPFLVLLLLPDNPAMVASSVFWVHQDK